jgi:adenine deaminase
LIFKGSIYVDKGRIQKIVPEETDSEVYIMPGFIDAHVHIESSMLIPSEFARLAVLHGTIATVSDPHEIANVMGIEGVRYMIANGEKVPFRFFFGAPSCVPATSFETSGAVLGVAETEELLKMKGVLYLSEMMNFPGVIYNDPEVMAKLALARKYNVPVDGHAPGLLGDQLATYVKAGISTDHECFTMEEALEKVGLGMKILVREGSAARNFDTLIPLLTTHPNDLMFCSDDKHPDELLEGHINVLVKRALKAGYNLYDVLRACSVNPVNHYHLPVGLLQEGDSADFIIVDHPDTLKILKTIIKGEIVSENGNTLIQSVNEELPNIFCAKPIVSKDILVEDKGTLIRVQRALDGQLITESFECKPLVNNGFIESDTERDILKILVMNRYTAATPSLGFINGFGLKKGALASTVAHDSHNIIAVGTNDEDIIQAVNLLIANKGGIAVCDGENQHILPLPVGGIMSADDGKSVAERYARIHLMAKDLGSPLNAPFMTLSFMALLVIPALKMSDKGLFDGNLFAFTSLYSKI